MLMWREGQHGWGGSEGARPQSPGREGMTMFPSLHLIFLSGQQPFLLGHPVSVMLLFHGLSCSKSALSVASPKGS